MVRGRLSMSERVKLQLSDVRWNQIQEENVLELQNDSRLRGRFFF